MDALVELPGVGRKTANVVLGHALGVPGLPVDRHVLRVANRLGIAASDEPETVETQLCAALPKERWTRASRHADPARPPRVPADADVRSLRGATTCAATSQTLGAAGRSRRSVSRRVPRSRRSAPPNAPRPRR